MPITNHPIQAHVIGKRLTDGSTVYAVEIICGNDRVQLDCRDHASAEKLRDSFIDTVSDIWIAVRG